MTRDQNHILHSTTCFLQIHYSSLTGRRFIDYSCENVLNNINSKCVKVKLLYFVYYRLKQSVLSKILFRSAPSVFLFWNTIDHFDDENENTNN